MKSTRARFSYRSGDKEYYRAEYSGKVLTFYIPYGKRSEEDTRKLLAMGMRLVRKRAAELVRIDNKAQAAIDFKDKAPKPKTMLEQIDAANVVGVFLMPNKDRLCLMEGCDGYYDIELTKSEAQQMVDELQAMVDLMEE